MDTLFFWASKLARPLLSPEGLLFLLLFLSWWLIWSGAHKTGRRLIGLIIQLVFIIALLPVGEWLFYPLEARFPPQPLPERVDGIIVLSGSEEAVRSAIWQQSELNGAAERNLAFLQLARRYPEARLVFSGGTGSLVNQEHKGTDVARRLFREQGLDPARVRFERESRNTYENAILSHALIKPQPGETWLLITTGWHMPRAVGVFCQAGWPVTPYAVDHRSQPGRLLRVEVDFADHLNNLNHAFHEWLGLAAYTLTGKTPALLPQRCDIP